MDDFNLRPRAEIYARGRKAQKSDPATIGLGWTLKEQAVISAFPCAGGMRKNGDRISAGVPLQLLALIAFRILDCELTSEADPGLFWKNG